jgi:hypothetical protein
MIEQNLFEADSALGLEGGGAIHASTGADGLVIRDNVLRNNRGTIGGAISIRETVGDVLIGENTFMGNAAYSDTAGDGGSILIKEQSTGARLLLIASNTFDGSHAERAGAAIHLRGTLGASHYVSLVKNIFARANSGVSELGCAASGSDDAFDTLMCNVFWEPYGGGTWDSAECNVGVVAENRESNPLFCQDDTLRGIWSESPCAPAHSLCGELIGADSVGCTATCWPGGNAWSDTVLLCGDQRVRSLSGIPRASSSEMFRRRRSAIRCT